MSINFAGPRDTSGENRDAAVRRFKTAIVDRASDNMSRGTFDRARDLFFDRIGVEEFRNGAN